MSGRVSCLPLSTDSNRWGWGGLVGVGMRSGLLKFKEGIKNSTSFWKSVYTFL